MQMRQRQAALPACLPARPPAYLPARLLAGWVGATAKQEGLVALGNCVVAIGDDNDFGVGGTPQSQLNIVRLPKCLTELYQASGRRCSWVRMSPSISISGS
jgi:hypothetical protein